MSVIRGPGSYAVPPVGAGPCRRFLAALFAVSMVAGPLTAQTPEDVARLVRLFDAPNADERRAAVILSGEWAVADRAKVREIQNEPLRRALREVAGPALARAAADPDPAVRRAAVVALGQVRAAGSDVAPAW